MANKAKAISSYAATLGIGALIGSASLAAATPGDAIYRTGGAEVCITAAQAACHADCSIADGSWEGDRADMHTAKAYRTSVCASGFAAAATGTKTAPLVDVPVGSIVDGVVE